MISTRELMIKVIMVLKEMITILWIKTYNQIIKKVLFESFQVIAPLWFHWNFPPYCGLSNHYIFFSLQFSHEEAVLVLNSYLLSFCRLLTKTGKFTHIKRHSVVCESELNGSDTLLMLFIQWKPIYIFKSHRWN